MEQNEILGSVQREIHKSSESTPGDEIPSASFIDERSRLERKIEKLREEITRNSIAREGDVEEYLKITSSIGQNRLENPQMTRIRQHFEKKNRKYTQETEQLQVVLYIKYIYKHFLRKNWKILNNA